MIIEIGKNINTLRREKGLTQEQLAEVFGVSVTAVSKWESSSSHPDITLLPKIASFFDISIDRLLGYNMSCNHIDSRIKEAFQTFYCVGTMDEGMAMLCELAHKYPNNVRVLTGYAKMKMFRFINAKPDDERRVNALNEAKEILSKIVIGTLSRLEYDEVLDTEYHLCMAEKDYNNAGKVIEKLRPGKDVSFYDFIDLHFQLGGWACERDGNLSAAEQKYHYNIFKGVEYLLGPGAWHIYYLKRNDPATVIMYDELKLKILLAITKDEPTYLDGSFSGVHESLAHMYACMGNGDKTLHHLEKAVEYGIRNTAAETRGRLPIYFNKLEDEIMVNVKTAVSNPVLKWAVNSSDRKEYDLVRDTDKFKELLQKIEEYNL